jgi:hypothetical protein
MSGWTVVDANTNKSQPITGKTDSGAVSPYITPAPGAQDPVGKMRISSPQALIDTDFEYGQQPTKWESIALQNNRPSCYYISQQPVVVSAITGTSTADQITITFTGTIGNGVPIYIQNSTNSTINGWGWVVTGGTNTTITVLLAPGSSTTTNAAAYYNAALTYVYTGYFYSGSGIQVASGTTSVVVTSSTVITVTTVNPHGLSKGSFVYIVGTTGGTNVNGAYIVATVPTANTFTVTAAAASGTVTTAAGQTNIYARPAGYVESRAFDGGVAFSATSGVPNSQLIRQTRRYFRYQSGKGIQFSTGTSVCPPLFVTSITASSATATVTTRFNHNLAVGCTVIVSGCDQGSYNGTFTIATVPTPSTFTYTMTSSPTVTTATGLIIKVSPINWYGSTNRVGFFDQQNGLFFEYDGQTLYAVWRNSVNQISGTVSVTQGSASVTGTGTQFSSQLKPGDFIVIRGQTYRVVAIPSDTSLYMTSEYRGATIAGALASKTIDTRVPRSQWLDPLDGTGPSGYILDLTKMQMWYIDYSWYGAGFSRFGLRTSKGQISYVYQFTNNNQRTEAYMRSGNMSAHYESNGVTPITYLTSTLASATTTGGVINVNDTSLFASSGTVKIQDATQTGNIEYITYSAKTASTLTITARAAAGGAGTAQTFTYSATAPISVEYAAPDTAASLSHWGSSVIMDGRFDDDKSLLFNYGTDLLTTVASATQVTPILAIRIAPAVDNGQIDTLGKKEIINRMQLQLSELGIYSGGPLLVNLILNGVTNGTFSGSFASPVTKATGAFTSSLSQVAQNTTNTVSLLGGESVAAAFTNTNGQTTLDLSQVRDLGNSILGGGTSNTLPTSQSGVYPDGPDILYVCVTPLTATATTVYARLSWKEAQA